jgi:hypothetical protein
MRDKPVIQAGHTPIFYDYEEGQGVQGSRSGPEVLKAGTT